MPIQYLLPCKCGRKVAIEPRHAGQTVSCVCGAKLNAPTLLRMADLERADSEPATASSPSAWGIREGLVLIGVVVVLTAIVLGASLAGNPPKPPQQKDLPPAEEIRTGVRSITAIQSLSAWREYRAVGLRRPQPTETWDYEAQLFRWRLWWAVVVVIGLVGMGLIGIPLVLRRIERSRLGA